MRDLSKWSQPLRKALRESQDLEDYVVAQFPDSEASVWQREVTRLTYLIADVELGLTLLSEVAPDEPAISVAALLLGYRFPLESLVGESNWQRVQTARFYLVRRKGNQWERSLGEYIRLPVVIRIFSLDKPDAVPRRIPTSTYPDRCPLYQQTLSKTPPHKKHKVKLVTPGYWYARIFEGDRVPLEIPINIPEAVVNLPSPPQVPSPPPRSPENPPVTVTLEALRIAATEMDECLAAQAGYDAENYEARLSGIALQLYDAATEDFQPGTALNLDRLVHIVGLLNVGKSTILEILIYHLAKQGYRCGLMVNDVATQVRLASLFWHGLGIPAAPILGSDRAQQLEKVYAPLLATQGEDIERGAIHPAWRWFSPVCPLLALVQSEKKWQFGDEPCHALYQKSAPAERKDAREEEDEESEIKDSSTCPFYYRCPRHQLERDIISAQIWILSPGSFIHTRLPNQGFTEKLTFAEAVYRQCHFLFVDEADRVQVQMDEDFAPDEVLVDASGNSLLNQLGLKFAAATYYGDRRNMAAERLATAKRANDYAQIAADIILPKLHNHPKLVAWLGSNPFTGRSVFAHIIRDILEPLEGDNEPEKTELTRSERSQQRRKRIKAGLPPQEVRKRRKALLETIEGFLGAPLNPSKGGELSVLALRLMSAGESASLNDVSDWLTRWLESLGVAPLEEAQFEEVVQHLHFAILVAVLTDRLGFLVDHLSEIARSRAIDLHDTSLSLLYRPPRDFLPVLPSAPVGNILGFKYTREPLRGSLRDRSSRKGGNLAFFRYVGVGRSLLLDFPTLFAADGWEGPHTVLISGTSYAPGTPAYHIRAKPTVLLEPARGNNAAGDAGIGESEFFFKPQQNAGKYIALSGLPPERRQLAAREMAKAICYRPGRAKSLLEGLFEVLEEKQKQDEKRWSDRQRLLLVTNSYEEAEWVESSLKEFYPNGVKSINEIAVLLRDNAPADSKGVRRGEVRSLKDLSVRIMVAPLMALERGHNILNDDKLAALGGAVFFSRPMPVPDDWQATVRQLNHWALENYADSKLYASILERGEKLTLANMKQEFYQHAIVQMLDLNCRAISYKHLTREERRVLCWTQLVSIWQIIGRLVRGGVPCLVHFLDVKFAPQSAGGDRDLVTTSLLVGILEALQEEIEGSGKRYEQTLARSLYGAFFNALKVTKDLNYDC